jgi:hypothetical protein
MIEDFISLFKSEILYQSLDVIWYLMPLWLPILLVTIFFKLWMNFKQREYIQKQGSVLLEIKIPREISKSPAAMEMFIGTLYNASAGSLMKVYLEGAVRPWFSLELVSIEGSVHFFIWSHAKFKSTIETQLYAQYPNVEVNEVPDYSLAVHHDPEKTKFGFIGHIVLTKADPYPIKTYIDYGLDKDPKEEYKNDPITSVLEYLGSLRKGEQAWIQILIQAHTKEGLKLGRLITKPDWKDAADKEIKSILKKATMKTEEQKTPTMLNLSETQKNVVSAIERSVSKYAFDTMIRAAYIAEKDAFNPVNIGGLLGSFKQFSSNSLNGFKPGFKSDYDYPWQDFRGKKKLENERDILEAYKRRSFFNVPFKNMGDMKPYILTAEELATLFHFPSAEVAATPTLSRIPSKKAVAPANLPI